MRISGYFSVVEVAIGWVITFHLVFIALLFAQVFVFHDNSFCNGYNYQTTAVSSKSYIYTNIHVMKAVLYTLLCAVVSIHALAQGIIWTTPVSIGASSYGNYYPRIMLDRSGDPLVTWGSSSNEAQFSRWTGSSFSTPTTLTASSLPIFSYTWAGPEIASYGDTVYVVVKEIPETDSTKHVYLFRSFDGGQNFSAPIRVDYVADSLTSLAAVTTDNSGHPIVTFMKYMPGMHHPVYVVTRSHDHGTSFMPNVAASSFAGSEVCDCCPPAIINEGSRTIMMFRNNLSNKRTMFAALSNDNGHTFNGGLEIDDTKWTVSICPSSGPDGVVLGDTLYAVYRSSAGGSSKVYLSKSLFTGPVLAANKTVTGNFTGISSQDYPRIARHGNAALVSWRQTGSGSSRAIVSFTHDIRSGFTDIDTVGEPGVNSVDVAISDGEVHLVWADNVSGTVKYVKGYYFPANVPNIDRAQHTRVYPNPAFDHFTTDIPNIAKCILVDISGKQTALNIQPGSTARISLEDVPTGTYVILLEDSSGKLHSSRLVKQ
jgi:hypothetical protein